ncbi:MAG: suppressor of fused domain protein, partial [Cellulomonadaceae bacterium]|nr:suppressor of fused domain protein [Cellulomonadaceae bacterium]
MTYGLSNLFDEAEGENDGFSGWGYELTWRVRDPGAAAEAPGWPFTVLQRLAKWASDGGVLLAEGSRLTIGSPVTGYPHTDGPDTPLTGVLLATDPELGEIDSANGRVRFLQFVAVDADTLALAQEEGSAPVLERLRLKDPLMVTELERNRDSASSPGAHGNAWQRSAIRVGTFAGGSASDGRLGRRADLLSDISACHRVTWRPGSNSWRGCRQCCPASRAASRCLCGCERDDAPRDGRGRLPGWASEHPPQHGLRILV